MRKYLFFILVISSSWCVFGQTASSLHSQGLNSDAVKFAEKGKKSFDKEDYNKARKYFNKAIAADQRAYHAYAYLAVIEGVENHNDKAVEEFKESLKQFDVFKAHMIERKTDYLKTMELEAISSQHTLDRRTSNYEPQSGENPALAQSNVNSQKSRVKELKKQLEKDKNLVYPAFFYFKYGNSLMKLKQVAEAKAMYESALTSDPKFIETYSNLAVAYFMTGDCEKALSTYHKGTELQAKFHPGFVKDLLANCGK